MQSLQKKSYLNCKYCLQINCFIFMQQIIQILLNVNIIKIDDNPQNDDSDEPDDSTPTLPERTTRGSPTNKNIPVRNIKAQIVNMSSNENAGFRIEYNVRYGFLIKYLLWNIIYIFSVLLSFK